VVCTIRSSYANGVCIRRFRRLAFAVLVVGLVAVVHTVPVSAQTTWVVSPTGSDSHPGTAAQPFLTIQHAADVVNPGDTVIVEDGTYTGTGVGTSCASSSKPIVCLTRGGTSTMPVTFRARNQWGAKLDGQTNTSTDGFRFVGNANYIVIEGFEVVGVGNAAGSSSGFELYNAGHDVLISHNNIHDVGRLCTDTGNGQAAIFLEQPNVEVTANYIHDIGRFMNGEHGCSTSYPASRDHGIYLDGHTSPGASNALIENNVFYGNARGWSIQLYPGSLSNISILNNTFAFPNPYQDGQILLGADLSNSRILNNIFYSPRTVALEYYMGTESSLSVTNNIIYNGSLFNKVPGGTTVLATQLTDPLLLNILSAPYDFHLTAASPAIDKGVTLAEVPVDFEDVSRTDGNDVGAAECAIKGTTTSPVSTPVITPAGGTYSGQVTVSLSTDTAGASIRYTTDGSVPTSSSPIYAVPLVLSASATVNALATEAGMADSAIATAFFQIQPAAADTVAPIVAITSPADGSQVRRWTTIAATATDDVGIVDVAFTLDGQPIGSDTTAPYAMTYNFRKTASGPHIITAIARDAAGNTATASITVVR
jgi:hypothetical protein